MLQKEIAGPLNPLPGRIYYVDWLRNLAVLLLVPFHTARIFDIWEPFYAKNTQLSNGLSYFIAFCGPWHMPLLFLLAGAASAFALGLRSGRQYAGERFKRLLIPFLFGLLVVIPPQTYLGALTHAKFSGSFFEYYPHFFEFPSEENSDYFGAFGFGHLWFIFFLFLFSVIALPLFLSLKKEAGKRLMAKLAAISGKGGIIFLWAIPLAIVGALPEIGGKNFFFFITLFIYGYFLMTDGRLQEVLDRYKTIALALGITAMIITLVIYIQDIRWPKYSTGDILFHFLRNFNTWFWLMALMGFGKRYLDFKTRGLQYTTEAAYPFYILHQTVIIIVGFFVVQWSAGLGLKFLIIAITSLGVILLIYDAVIRRMNLLRFLFGMKLVKKALQEKAKEQGVGAFQ